LTENIFSKPNRNLSTICYLLITVEEENKNEAILYCINLPFLTLPIAKIQYYRSIDWCTSLCTVLNQVFCQINAKITPTSNRDMLTIRFLDEYVNITTAIKQQIEESLSTYEEIFRDLTNISD
jgi:DNA-directed RNA polymerase subunit L